VPEVADRESTQQLVERAQAAEQVRHGSTCLTLQPAAQYSGS
jgi:hypothetical protein